jgi:hypothetical protein
MLKWFLGLFRRAGDAVGAAAEAIVADDQGNVAPEPVTDFHLPDDYAGTSTVVSATDGPQYKRAVAVPAPKAPKSDHPYEDRIKRANARGCYVANGRAKRAYATKAEADKTARKTVGTVAYRCKAHGWHVGHELSRNLRKALTKAARKKK